MTPTIEELQAEIERLREARDTAYRDRNYAVLLAAKLARFLGLPVTCGVDEKEVNWPVVYIQLPCGQVSWHLSPGMFARIARNTFPKDKAGWDGHTTDEKNTRIRSFLRTGIKRVQKFTLALSA